MIDITAVWASSHGHLKPYGNHLPLPAPQLHTCPLCSGGGDAFYVLSDLQIQGGAWVRNSKVLYCPDCERFMVDAELFSHVSTHGQPVVCAVDARLWSSGLTFLDVEPTTRCNYRCWYCIGRHMVQEDIRVEDFDKILDHAPAVNAIALVGEGEPLLHKGFFDMAQKARANGKKVLIISNGSLLNDANVKNLCESGVVYVAISIDSTDPEEFSSSRPCGDLAEVLRGISRLRTYRDAHGYNYPKIAVKGTLFDYTEHELANIVRLAREHGAEILESFQPLNPKHSYVAIYPEDQKGQLAAIQRVGETIAKDSQVAQGLLRSAAEFLAEEGLEFGGQGNLNSLRGNCDEQYVYSLLSGDITPCCQVKTPVDPQWNIIDHPLDEIFRNQNYENMRFNLWNGLFPEYCSGCCKTC